MSSTKINWNYYSHTVNINFFKKWGPQMAYIFGFTCADGNIHGRALSWDLSDKEESNKKLLVNFNRIMDSNYPLEKRKNSFRLRISNQIILNDIKKLGMIPNKKKLLLFPYVPEEYLRDFVRGFLDGDGWIAIRYRENAKEICVGFSNGSLLFMRELVKRLNRKLALSSNNLRERTKITPKGIMTTFYHLEYSSHNAFKLIEFLYNNLKEDDLYLGRKFKKQLEARKVYEEYSLKTKLWRETELKFDKPMKKILYELMFKENLDGIQIAKKLNTHSSTIYRWLEKTEVRQPSKRGSEEWIKRALYRNWQNK